MSAMTVYTLTLSANFDQRTLQYGYSVRVCQGGVGLLEDSEGSPDPRWPRTRNRRQLRVHEGRHVVMRSGDEER
ncbi:hypothetical protein EYF80_021521 [Liparis tanakae]|uniref:Uncharacterized protein n=1 Tax=Liparis tanakae TaxID=230148 RepID=A0A4Z2HQT0_9TELE|nr:hypothetical protein EYF80_021521 [Liparis tanakae]